jgi:hypothetical protein
VGSRTIVSDLRDTDRADRMGFPSIGSWVTYGLGSEATCRIRGHPRRARQPLGGVNDWTSGCPRGLSGDAVPLERRSDRRSEAAVGGHAGAAAPAQPRRS